MAAKTMPATEHTLNDEKLRELILLIAQESEGDGPFGATKLNKLLFYADFLAYRQLGKSITEQDYMRLPQGPAPRRMLRVTKGMEANKELAISIRPYLGKKQKRPMALRAAELGSFSASEIDLVHKLLKQCVGKSASEMSELSHRFMGWRLAQERETIPYSVALVSRGPRSEAAEKHAATLAAKAQGYLDSGRGA